MLRGNNYTSRSYLEFLNHHYETRLLEQHEDGRHAYMAGVTRHGITLPAIPQLAGTPLGGPRVLPADVEGMIYDYLDDSQIPGQGGARRVQNGSAIRFYGQGGASAAAAAAAASSSAPSHKRPRSRTTMRRAMLNPHGRALCVHVPRAEDRLLYMARRKRMTTTTTMAIHKKSVPCYNNLASS
jgi:hypothetical protein